MKSLLVKELKLSASPLSFLFLLFGAMVLIPNYPILVGAFFICFGIFQTFQSARENNDTLYTVMLPVRKTDVVRARFAFAGVIQLVGFVVMLVLTIVRMDHLADAPAYASDALLRANPVFLAWVPVIFGVFNITFIRGYYKTGYKFGKPFVVAIIAIFLVITLAEVLHHIPGLAWMNSATAAAVDEEGNVSGSLWPIVATGAALYALLTWAALKLSIRSFNAIDL